MKKIDMKKISALFLAFVVAFGTLAASTVSVNAKSSSWSLWVPKPVWTGTMYSVDVYNEDYESAKIVKVTTSDKSVLKVVKEKYDGKTYYYMKGKKNGKAQVTVTYKKPSGKKATLKKTITVKKYPYEIKSLKVNGKTVKIKDNKFYYGKKTSKEQVTIKMALKKGWKIESIYADRSKDGKKFKQFTVKKSTLTSGKAIKFSKKYKELYINVQLKKGKDTIYYTFDFFRE